MEVQTIKDTMDYFKCVFILESLEIDLTNKSASLKEVINNHDERLEYIYKMYVYPAAMYREYLNNFLTTERFAEYYGFTHSVAVDLINAGKKINDDMVNQFRALSKK